MSLHYQLAFSGGKLVFKDGGLGMTEAGELDDFCYCCSCPPTNDCKYPDGSPQTCSNGKNIALPQFLKVTMSGIVVQTCINNFPDWASFNDGCSCPRASGAGTCGVSFQFQNTDLDFAGLTPNPADDSPCNYGIVQDFRTPGAITFAQGDKCCTVQDEGFVPCGWGWYAAYNASTQLLTVIMIAGDNADTTQSLGTITVIPIFFLGTATVPCGTWKPTDTITVSNTLTVGQEITSGSYPHGISAGGGVELWACASGGTCTIQCLKTDPGVYAD